MIKQELAVVGVSHITIDCGDYRTTQMEEAKIEMCDLCKSNTNSNLICSPYVETKWLEQFCISIHKLLITGWLPEEAGCELEISVQVYQGGFLD